MTVVAERLTAEEESRLAELEQTIARGVQSFVETGRALLEVQQRRLYRAEFRTFEDYCRERWDLSRSRAYQLIDAATVVEVVSTSVDTAPPATEAVARELAPLKRQPDRLVEVWEGAAQAAAEEGRPVTRRDVREARRDLERPAAPVPVEDVEPDEPESISLDGDAADDLRFEHITDAVQVLRMLPAPERIVWPTDPGDIEEVGEAVEWLADFAPRLRRAWREHRRRVRRLRAV